MEPRYYGKEWEQKAVAGNAKWIREQAQKGEDFIVIGTDEAANRSPFYAAEKKALPRVNARVFKGSKCAVARARASSKTSARPNSRGRY